MVQPVTLAGFDAFWAVYPRHEAKKDAQKAWRQIGADVDDALQARILARLREGPALNTDLNAIAFRFGGRIHELRREGYDITTEPLHGGLVRYTLHPHV